MERVVRGFSNFCREKRQLHIADKIINIAYTTKLVGFNRVGDESGEQLPIRGFKGEDRLMWRNAVRDGLKDHDSVLVTTFDSDGVVFGSVEILSRRVHG